MERKDKIPEELITKFIEGKRLSADEIILLDKLFNDKSYFLEIADWLENNWEQSETTTVALKFDEIRKRIGFSSKKYRMNRLYIVLSKAAAVLFIPLLAAVLYFYLGQSYSHELLTFATQKGEQTSVILPDGSEVWLNVDTKLSLPVNYGIKNRDLILEGEAYFEVEENKKLPFIVTSGNVTTEALGTRFAVSAYPEADVVKTSLVDGSVKVGLVDGKNSYILKSGQQLSLIKRNSSIAVKSFDKSYELSWIDDELIFRLTPFRDVIVKLEKWYDINIEYDADLFKKDTLTVRFERYETLENVLKIISKATGFSYSIKGKDILIMRDKT